MLAFLADGNMKKLLMCSCLFLITSLAFADPLVCKLQSGGVFDSILSNFFSTTSSFVPKILPKVTQIYWLLFGLEFVYELTFEKIMKFNLEKLYVWFVIRIFIGFMFAHIFLDPSFYSSIIKLFVQAGGTMSGSTINITGPNPLGDFTPSAILGANGCVSSAISAVMPTNFITGASTIIMLLILQYGFMIVTVVIAMLMFLVIIESYVVLFSGFFMTAFAGSSWTKDFWYKYMTSVVRIGIKMMLMAGLFSICYTQILQTVNGIANSTDLIANYPQFIQAVIEMLILAVVMFTVPAGLAASLSGGFAGTMHSIGTSMALKGANMASGGMSKALTVGGNFMGGGSPNPASTTGKSREIFGGSNQTAGAKPQDWKQTAKPNLSQNSASAADWKIASNSNKS